MQTKRINQWPLQVKKAIEPVFVDDVGLRLLEKRDIELLRTWRNRDDIRIFFEHSETITVEQQKLWFSAYQERSNDYYFVIYWHNGQDYLRVGGLSIYAIADGKAEYGRCLIGDDRARHRGVMVKASRILLDIGRTELGLSELYLKVFRTNLRAIRVYEKIGFYHTARDQDEKYTFMSLTL